MVALKTHTYNLIFKGSGTIFCGGIIYVLGTVVETGGSDSSCDQNLKGPNCFLCAGQTHLFFFSLKVLACEE